MKLVLIALGLLAWPVVTWWAENRADDEDSRNVIRMADRDRRQQAVRPMNRRMRYAVVGNKKSPGRSGNSYQGQSKITINRIAQDGGYVK